MGRRGLAMVGGALVLSLTLGLAVRWITSPVSPERRPGPRTARPGSHPRTSAPVAATDPNLPLFVGDTRRLAARAIDDTARAPFDQALVALGRRFLGSPSRSSGADAGAEQRLELDLNRFEPLSYVEQLLALVNSRQVRTRTEGVDRFSDHVRQLRYAGGRVDPCRRLSHPSVWAAVAERRGYLVDLSRFLPGARRQTVPLPPARPTARGEAGAEGAAACAGTPLTPPALSVASLPLTALPAALTNLRGGDLFVLVGAQSDARSGRVGLVDIDAGRVGGLLVQPGRGVVRVDDLQAHARSVPGTIGLSFLRPVPNGDGRPDR